MFYTIKEIELYIDQIYTRTNQTWSLLETPTREEETGSASREKNQRNSELGSNTNISGKFDA